MASPFPEAQRVAEVGSSTPVRARLSSAVSASTGQPGRVERELFRHLGSAGGAPMRAACAALILDTSPDLWHAYVWHADGLPRLHRLPSPPPFAWLGRVVMRGESFAVEDATEADDALQGGFPWLDRPKAWLALPVEDAAGMRIGAMAIASRESRTWGWHVERGLAELVKRASAAIERVWLRAELARMREASAAAERVATEARERRDALLGVLGHELRNPLSPLSTAVELVRARAPLSLHPELAVMERQVWQLRRLVDDLMDYSRLFRSDLALQLSGVPLRDLLFSAAARVRPLIDEHGHTLEIEAAPELTLQADEDRLLQIVVALVANAAKHGPPRSLITLAARAHGEEVEVVVSDRGGMSARSLATAFEPFHGSRSEGVRSGGLGLGLPIARALAGRHGGSLELRSAGPGTGTEAVLRMPCRPAVLAAGANDEEPAYDLPIVQAVLVVDDNRDAADMLADAIRRWGAMVAVAYDGAHALLQARETRFGVALVDIGMPHMNGFELARALRRVPGGADLRIIAVTGFGEPDDAERSHEAGMDAHLVKPVALAELRRVLAEVPAE